MQNKRTPAISWLPNKCQHKKIITYVIAAASRVLGKPAEPPRGSVGGSPGSAGKPGRAEDCRKTLVESGQNGGGRYINTARFVTIDKRRVPRVGGAATRRRGGANRSFPTHTGRPEARISQNSNHKGHNKYCIRTRIGCYFEFDLIMDYCIFLVLQHLSTPLLHHKHSTLCDDD